MSLLNNGTLANPTTPYYALATESAKNWYNFPTLNGEIKMNDSTGTQLLQAIGGDLYFNDELLAKAGDIQNITDWSLYPQLSTLQGNNQAISNVSDVQSSTLHTSTIFSLTAQMSTATLSGSINANTATIGTGLGSIVSISGGGVTADGVIRGSGLATTAGINMTNTGITNASAIGLSAAGLPPYGSLTSPDGTLLTWNGATITTGGASSASNWSFYPQLSNLTTFTATQISTASLTASTINGIAYPPPSGDVTQWALNPALSTVQFAGLGAVNVGSLSGVSSINNTAYSPTQNWSQFFANSDVQLDGRTLFGGTDCNLNLVGQNGDANLLSEESNVNITSESGAINLNSYYTTRVNCSDCFITADAGIDITNTPNINIIAQNGPLGGNIDISAKGGYGGVAGYGKIALNAFGTTGVGVGNAGLIELNAYSSVGPDLIGLTSAIRQTAASVGISAGVFPSIPAFAGGLVLNGTSLVSITAGLPAILPQLPGTIYQYGITGVTIESPGYIDLRTQATYTNTIYPGNTVSSLVIRGRSFPSLAGVQLMDVESINMAGTGAGAAITAVSSINNMGFEDAVIKNISSILVSSINGFEFPQTVVIPSTFSDFYASTIQVNNIQSLNNSTITIDAPVGSGLIIAGDIANGGFLDINNQNTISTLNFAMLGNDVGGTYLGGNTNSDFSYLWLNKDGAAGVELIAPRSNVLIAAESTINISSSTVNITTNDGINITTSTAITLVSPSIDVSGAEISNVANLSGSTGSNLAFFSYGDLNLIGSSNTFLESSAGSLQLSSQLDVNIDATAGGINLGCSTEVIVETSILNMNNHKITNVSPGTTSTDAVNFDQLTFKDTTEFWVSGQGSDANNGSMLSPFRTIQAAITAAELISSAASICNINVASGSYTENLTFNKGYVVLTGTLQSQTGNETCEITGSITINCVGANDVFNRQVTFQGFNITLGAAQSISDTSSASHTVSFQDCKIFANSVCFNSASSAPDMRFYMTNVEIQQTNAAFTGSVITTNVGLVEFERLDLNLTGNATGIAISGTSVLSRCSLGTFDASSTAAILRPLLQINSTTTSTHSLGQIAYSFSSAVAKTNTSAVYINSGIDTAIIMLNNVFTLAGTADASNYCVGYNGTGTPTIAGFANTSLSVNVVLPQATRVQPGITQIQYTNVDPPVLGSYSSSVDQPIAVGGTPQALTFNTSQNFHGTLLVSGTRIYVGSQGNYQINYACTLINSSASAVSANVFLRKNGTTVANTGTVVNVPASNVNTQVSPQAIVSMNNADYIEVWFTGPLTVSANATGAVGIAAATPSVICNITQIR